MYRKNILFVIYTSKHSIVHISHLPCCYMFSPSKFSWCNHSNVQLLSL